MSESSNMVLRRNPKHVKGKYSMSKPSYLISIDNENVINNHNVNKSNNNNTSSQNIKETRLSVKGMNNKSFVLRPKKVKEINEKFDKISFNKLSYKVGRSFVNSNKKLSMNPNKNNLEKKVQNPIHTRIKSFQVELKDNYFSNNLNSISRTERNNYKENISTNRNKIKKKKLNELEYTYNEYSTNNNINFNKTTVFEDIEESTKNTKLFDQKIETLDNISSDEKYLILSDRNPKRDKNTLKSKKSRENNNNNNKKFKRLGNISNLNSNKNKFNNSFHRRNRAFSPTMKNKLSDIRKNIFENKEPTKRDSTPLNNEKRLRDTRDTKDMEEEKNVKEIEHRKKISNLIQKIKNKIQINQIIKNEYNSNTVRNTNSKNMSFVRERKTISNGFYPSQIKKNSINTNNKNNNNKNENKPKKKIKIINKPKSPITFRRQNNNILNELNKNKNNNNNNNKKDSSSIVQIKDNKNNFSKKKNMFNNSFLRKDHINKKSNKNIKTTHNETENNKNKEKQKICGTSKSQNDVFSDFIIKTLNNEEEKIKSNKKNTKKQKEKGPKDLEEKTIEKMDNLCQKGFSGPGVKKINQDNFFIYNNFLNNPDYLYLGVCDGHGTYGHNVSGYLVYNLPLTLNDILIKEKIEYINKDNINKIKSIIEKTFLEIDKDIMLDTRIDSLFSGSTCVSLIYTPSKLICANLGDSRCVLGKYDGKNWSSKNISYDHKPNNPIENERIIQNGGRVESYKDEEGKFVGPKRVWLKNEDVPGLAMSRSFGDGVAHSVGVIAEPEIIEYSLLHEDKFIILASDGIWEFITSDECVGFVKDFYIKKDINGALNFLYKEASKRWIIEEEVIDDITLILIFFDN